MSKIKTGIIFDLDGTLWNSTEQAALAWREVLLRHRDIRQPVSVDEIRSYMGLTMDDIFMKLMPNIDKNIRRSIQKECQDYENCYLAEHSGVVYDGVESTLQILKNDGYRLYIVSNCQDGYVQAFLKSSGLAIYFDDYEMFGRTNLNKCDNIRLIIRRNELDNAVYVGDIMSDYISTTKAGIEFIHARYGFGEVADAKYFINRFDELPKVIDTIFNM